MLNHLHIHLRQLVVIIVVFFLLIAASVYVRSVGFDSLKQIMQSMPLVGLVLYSSYVVISTILTTLPIVPVWPITYSFYGYWPSVIATMVGVIIGATACFLLTRRFGRPFVKKIVHDKFLKELDHIINGKNSRSFVIFRIFGNNYFDIVSYAAGLSKISLKRYFIVTTITSTFWTLVIFYVISRASQLESKEGISVMGIGYLAMAVVGFIVWRSYIPKK